MAYTAPITFVAGDPLTAAQLNVMQDNFIALKDPPTGAYKADEVSDYTTNSTTFVDVDATNFSFDITTTGGDVLVSFYGYVSGGVFIDFTIDGVREGGTNGLQKHVNAEGTIEFSYLKRSLAAGTYTFRLQWASNAAASRTLYAGAGTAGYDVHPQFFVREV